MAWVTVKDAAVVASMTEQAFRGKYRNAAQFRLASSGFEVLVSSLPAAIQRRCAALADQAAPESSIDGGAADASIAAPPSPPPTPAIDMELSLQAETYAKAPSYNRAAGDRRTLILTECAGLTGDRLEEYVAQRKRANPADRVSAATIYRWRAKRESGGSDRSIAKYGKRRGLSCVPDDLFDYFKRLFLKEGSPSQNSCYMITVGEAIQRGYDPSGLPKVAAFMRRLRDTVPPQAIHLAQCGPSANNRKYGEWVIRDYSKVAAGHCWVSDHVQADFAVTCVIDGKECVRFPWYTVMRDFKTGKWLSWWPHCEAPNSDHIFAAFYLAAMEYGLPSKLYIDNGKDYRCREFSGGRSHLAVDVDERSTRSLCGQLKITVLFANPYNAQTKPIERDFLTNKSLLSKHASSYRGGNVVERPEGLAKKIAAGQIPSFDEMVPVFDKYIRDVLMVLPVMSKRSFRYGMSPNEMWAADKRSGSLPRVSEASLAMFCRRVSKAKTIGRNGIYDSDIFAYYYADWMLAKVGVKVYLRRAPGVVEEAWVCDAEHGSLLGKALWIEPVPALVESDADREKLSKNLARVRQARKLSKAYADTGPEIPIEEKVENMAIYAKSLRPDSATVTEPAEPQPRTTLLTKFDIELAELNSREKEGLQDLSAFGSLDLPKKHRVFTVRAEVEEAAAAGDPDALAILERSEAG